MVGFFGAAATPLCSLVQTGDRGSDRGWFPKAPRGGADLVGSVFEVQAETYGALK